MKAGKVETSGPRIRGSVESGDGDMRYRHLIGAGGSRIRARIEVVIVDIKRWAIYLVWLGINIHIHTPSMTHSSPPR